MSKLNPSEQKFHNLLSNFDHPSAPVLRSMVQFESEQINSRVNTLVVIQGLLFVAAGFSWDKAGSFVFILSVVGIFMSTITIISLVAPILALRNLNSLWLKINPKQDGIGIFGHYPSRQTQLTFFSPDNFLPLVFIMAWFAVLMSRLP